MTTSVAKKTLDLKRRREAPLSTPTDLKAAATRDITAAMNGILADAFALYIKTKNFHWHLSGPHFRDYHLLLDEHADQIFAMTTRRLWRACGRLTTCAMSMVISPLPA